MPLDCRIPASIGLACVLCAAPEPACARQDDAPSDATAPAARPVASDAEALLDEMIEAYQAAPALTDRQIIKVTMGGGGGRERAYTFEVALDDTSARLKVPGGEFTQIDQQVYVVLDGIDDKYLPTPLEQDLPSTLSSLFGSFDVPVHFALRGNWPREELLRNLTMRQLQGPALSGTRLETADDGTALHVLLISAGTGSMEVAVDAQSKLIRSATMLSAARGAAGETRVKSVFEFDPKTYDKLPEAIAFDPGDRAAVNTLDELRPAPPKLLAEGDPAPDFTLHTLEGETVTLSDLRGNVVVLDFWATWCVPCRRGLPLLQQFHDWAATAEQPVKVFAVDTLERGDKDQALEKVERFWKEQGFTMPTLVDRNDTLAQPYGLVSIPLTVVVGPDGNVAALHRGFNPAMVDLLKRDVSKALESSG